MRCTNILDFPIEERCTLSSSACLFTRRCKASDERGNGDWILRFIRMGLGHEKPSLPDFAVRPRIVSARSSRYGLRQVEQALAA